MNERDLFDAFGRLPESYRLDALEHTEQQEQNETSEINAIFTETIRKNAGINAETVDIPENIQEESHCADVKDIQPPASRPKASPVRNFTIGVTAVAAAIALTVGIMVFRVKKEAEEAIGTPSASSSAESIDTDISEQTDSDLSGVTDTANETAADIIIIQEQTLPETTTTAQAAPFYETNVFGGEGTLRVLGSAINSDPICEDDAYWYLGTARMSKTAVNEHGNHYWEKRDWGSEYLPESSDGYYPNYPNLLTDGEALYVQDETKSSVDIGKLLHINPDGTVTEFLQIGRNDTIGSDAEDIPYSIHFQNIQKLGDSGNYLIAGYTNSLIEREDLTTHLFALIYMPETEKIFFLPMDYPDNVSWQYDAGTDRLYGFSVLSENHTFTVYTVDVQTGKIINTAKDIYYSGDWIDSITILNGKTYFLQSSSTMHDFITDGKVNGGQLIQKKSLRAYDFETDTIESLQEDTDISALWLCGGRLACQRDVRVGKDQIFFLEPEDMSEEIIYETPNDIQWIYYGADPDHILFAYDDFLYSGFYADGELITIESSQQTETAEPIN